MIQGIGAYNKDQAVYTQLCKLGELVNWRCNSRMMLNFTFL